MTQWSDEAVECLAGWIAAQRLAYLCEGEPTNPEFFGQDSEDDRAGADGYCRGCWTCWSSDELAYEALAAIAPHLPSGLPDDEAVEILAKELHAEVWPDIDWDKAGDAEVKNAYREKARRLLAAVARPCQAQPFPPSYLPSGLSEQERSRLERILHELSSTIGRARVELNLHAIARTHRELDAASEAVNWLRSFLRDLAERPASGERSACTRCRGTGHDWEPGPTGEAVSTGPCPDCDATGLMERPASPDVGGLEAALERIQYQAEHGRSPRDIAADALSNYRANKEGSK
jgi:hypothetical protein